MKYFINKDRELYSFDFSDSIFRLFKDEVLFLSHKTKLEKIHQPIKPIYIQDILILFDYEKGIEIINENNITFLNLKAIYMAEIMNDLLLAFSHKKMYVINYVAGKIVEEISISENFKFRLNNDYAFFYRIKHNLSYLYQINSNKIIELGNLLKDDMSILKLLSSNDFVHIFFFIDSGEEQKSGVLNINIYTNQISKEIFDEFSAVGYQYLPYFNGNIDEKINIKYDDYGEMIYSIFKKYGVFMAFYLTNERKMRESINSKYYWIYNHYSKYKEIMEKYRVLKSGRELKNLENELRNLSINIDRYL